MIRRVLISLLLFCSYSLMAQEQSDTAFKRLYQHYFELFSSNKKDEFYKTSVKIQQYFIAKKDFVSYYKIRQNEILFDTQHGETYKAIKKANVMLEDMKNDKVNRYDLVYASLGAIFESRGNYRMAEHYYMDAIHNIAPEDTLDYIHAVAQIVSLKVSREPDKAWEWNERMGAMTTNGSTFYKVYLALKGQIHFFKGDKTNFLKTKKEYDKCAKQTNDSNPYGRQLMDLIQKTFEGNYQEALQLLEQDIADLTEIGRCDYRIRIYEIMGEGELALREVNKRRDLRDSLNSDMLFNNINEINAEVGIAKIHEQATKEREFWFFAVILLLIIALALTISRYLVRRRYQKKILRQNEQLEIALSEAKESDRMKSSFIEHVSHEIRTPLNVITGYAQIITNPDYELDTEERNNMLQSIAQNTTAITNIVNDLLEIAQDESKERYRREDTINVNALCHNIMAEMEQRNNGRLKLTFFSKLPDEFTIRSNQSGIEKILRHLLSNALKFTEQGQVELFVHESPDHGCMRFIVTDTGIGIDKEHQEKVFERFYKVDSFKQGFGLGLTMSRKIAQQLGGALAIDKGYENGTRLVLTVPVR